MAAGGGWHLTRPGPLAIAAGTVKLAAVVVAADAVRRSGDGPGDISIARIVQIVLFGILASGLTWGMSERAADREILAMAVAVPNIAAHWAMAVAAGSAPEPDGRIALFCLLMIAGDAIGLRLLSRRPPDGLRRPRGALMALAALYIAGYAAIAVLLVFT